MKVAMIGTGYVGLVTGTCFAATGNNVICVDVAEQKIENLKKGIIPIYEPGLEQMVKSAQQRGNLKFTTDIKEALKEQTEAMGTDPTEFLGHNPFTASMEVKLASDYANTDSLKWIEKRIKQNKNVVEIVYQHDLMDAVNTNVRRASLILLCLAVLLSLISFALINNTIRLSIYSQRFSIYTMKLVGASWGFIRKPYIIRNLWIGIVSGLLADGILMSSAYLMVAYEPELLQIVTLNVMTIVLSSVFLFGLIITFLCAYFSVNKYLRMKASALYYI